MKKLSKSISSRRTTSIRKQRGDTLVEVTIAMAVLGLILASTTTIINKSLMGVMNSVERTAVSGEVNSQVELLRYVFATQTGVNQTVAKQIVSKYSNQSASDMANFSCTSVGDKAAGKAFYLYKNDDGDTNTSQPIKLKEVDRVSAEYRPKAKENGGVWIDGVKYNSRTDSTGHEVPGYIDFYVRACWTPYSARELGQGQLESIVRVYWKEEK